ncbi:MAG: RDD family protein [Lewinellaceae bacterium]|nr:RDD family protein [Lewinellaceae bacterium]
MPYLLRRSLAYLIDCTIAFLGVVLVLQAGILKPLRSHWGITDEWFHSGVHTELYTLLTISLPVWLYFSLLEASARKAAFGKQLMGLEVVGKDEKAGLPFKTSFFRTVLKLLPWEMVHLGLNLPSPAYFEDEPGLRILPVFGLLLIALYLWSLLRNHRRQTVYDQLLGAYVIQKEKKE